jgi:gluconate 2-dehydrogenase gamma chain
MSRAHKRTRREFLTLPAAAIGGTLIYTLAGEPVRLKAQGLMGEEGMVRVPLRFFTEAEARVVIAACERIFPNDATGPGATEAGVVVYIDRQLAGPYGRDKYRYTKGPWIDPAVSLPEHGYQGQETPQQTYRKGIADLGDFTALSAEDQIARLTAIERTRFFQLLRTHTVEGMFCDPMHGGNAGLIGWQLAGFPGPRMSYREEIDKHFGERWRPKPASLLQIMGRTGPLWEDEKG